MIRVTALIFSIFIFCSTAYGEKQSTAKQHNEQLNAAATVKGVYAQYDRWPKDYFLIPQNLPFMVGLSLYHQNNKNIALNEEQKTAIHAIRDRTVPVVLVLAGSIKERELELAEKFVVQKIEPQKLYALVDEIAAMRADLTKAHMACIQDVQKVLDDKQYEALLKLAATMTHHKEKESESR